MNRWRCSCCAAPNAPEDDACRVCRAERPGIELPRPSLDPQPFGVLRALPAPIMLAGLSLVLWYFWEPITRPLAATNVHSGWSAETHRDRRDELRAALRDLDRLAAELKTAMTTQAPLPSDWNARLSDARLKWQIYGQQEWSPGLGDVEALLNDAVLKLASIRHQLASGTPTVDALERHAEVQKMLDIAERRLKDAH